MPGRSLLAVFVCLAGFVGLPAVAAEPQPASVVAPAEVADPVLVGAGDVAGCDANNDEATGRLLDNIPGTVFIAGDSVYENGTAAEYANCFEPAWGRHKARIRPALGDHEMYSPGAAPYFNYFGAAAGAAPTGYYSYDLGSWHVVSLNSQCAEVPGGCGPDSPQLQWLRADLASTTAECIAAVWHRHRFTSGSRHHGKDDEYIPFWDTLRSFGADVVLNGHSHLYERFGLQDTAGNADPNGIRQFTVGTGGRFLDTFGTAMPNSEFRFRDDAGVLKLTLHAASYDWQFIRASGATVVDSGSTGCHTSAPSPPPPPPPPPPPSPITLAPEADARVVEGSPTANFGTQALLEADNSPVVQSFLRFNVSGISAPVTRARLRLYATDPTGNGPALYRADPGALWAETGINWNNKPGRAGGAIANVGSISAGRYIDYDVTGTVTANGTYTFNLGAESTDGADFNSREAGSNRPQLVIEMGTTGGPAPGPGPAPGSTTLTPQADARVMKDSPNSNYGGGAVLGADNSPVIETYLRFNVAGISGTVTRARLRFFVTNGTGNAPAVYRADPNVFWSETGITWNNKPPRIGGIIANLGSISANRSVEYDVTTAVTGNGTYTFNLKAESSDGADFVSKDAAGNRPQLVIETS